MRDGQGDPSSFHPAEEESGKVVGWDELLDQLGHALRRLDENPDDVAAQEEYRKLQEVFFIKGRQDKYRADLDDQFLHQVNEVLEHAQRPEEIHDTSSRTSAAIEQDSDILRQDIVSLIGNTFNEISRVSRTFVRASEIFHYPPSVIENEQQILYRYGLRMARVFAFLHVRPRNELAPSDFDHLTAKQLQWAKDVLLNNLDKLVRRHQDLEQIVKDPMGDQERFEKAALEREATTEQRELAENCRALYNEFHDLTEVIGDLLEHIEDKPIEDGKAELYQEEYVQLHHMVAETMNASFGTEARTPYDLGDFLRFIPAQLAAFHTKIVLLVDQTKVLRNNVQRLVRESEE